MDWKLTSAAKTERPRRPARMRAILPTLVRFFQNHISDADSDNAIPPPSCAIAGAAKTMRSAATARGEKCRFFIITPVGYLY